MLSRWCGAKTASDFIRMTIKRELNGIRRELKNGKDDGK